MILQAQGVGELAFAQMKRVSEGRVTRVFRRSVYVETCDGLIVLLQGGLRSPVTVNLGGDTNIERLVTVGELCRLGRGSMKFDEFELVKDGASVYRSSLLGRIRVSILEPSELAKGAAGLSLLYDVSPPSLDIIGSEQFSQFVELVVGPLGLGMTPGVYRIENYLPLIGLGSGFTPAGDDFVAGFVAAFNFVARSLGTREVMLPMNEVVPRTVPESAKLLDYAQRGHADEELSRLVLSATSAGHESFWNDLLDLARRGHTSGIDTSLGVILAAASIGGALGKHNGTERVLASLSRLRTL